LASDLSVLASSQFDGMEGIGHNSSTLVQQDDQDSEGMEGIEGSRELQINSIGGIQAQGLVLSPRKTRSGRVVKYKGDKL
jgi:hypothetical protein